MGVLVPYATRQGATAGIAERVAAALTAGGVARPGATAEEGDREHPVVQPGILRRLVDADHAEHVKDQEGDEGDKEIPLTAADPRRHRTRIPRRGHRAGIVRPARREIHCHGRLPNGRGSARGAGLRYSSSLRPTPHTAPAAPSSVASGVVCHRMMAARRIVNGGTACCGQSWRLDAVWKLSSGCPVGPDGPDRRWVHCGGRRRGQGLMPGAAAAVPWVFRVWVKTGDRAHGRVK
jgi:hypothetical protein